MHKKISFKFMLTSGNFIILIFLILITSSLMYSIDSLIKSSKWVAHTHNVLEHISLLEKLMVDMETGQRGFILTGNDNFLDPYSKGKKLFDEKISSAEKLVQDNPAQVKRFSLVEDLKDRWLRDAGEFEIDLKRKVDKGEIPAAVLKHILEGKKIDGTAQSAEYKSGKDIMDDIRMQLREIESIERKLLEERAHTNNKTAHFAKNSALYGTIITVIISILMINYMSKLLYGQLGAEPKNLQIISQKVSNGDLRVDFDEKTMNTDGTLAKSFAK